MQEADLRGVFKTLLYIIAIYYIVKFLARLFLPVIAKKVVEKATQQFQEQAQQQQQNAQDNYNSSAKSDKPRETKKVGEYIDYEEID
ncbi:DUF4834 domain-containing protein [Flavobacterium sp.]|uniref:DUF4834 domain-containing protein n=1 Tax=Flavobacterium sp. TaxID=239 RepID=UPI00261FE2C3|nr:DUF4834 domain-containing protein [Flavobacterium sp.]